MSRPLYIGKDLPFEVYEISLLDADDGRLRQTSEEMGLALNIEEMKAVKRYFSKGRRNPTDVELQTIGQTWSEHC